MYAALALVTKKVVAAAPNSSGSDTRPSRLTTDAVVTHPEHATSTANAASRMIAMLAAVCIPRETQPHVQPRECPGIPAWHGHCTCRLHHAHQAPHQTRRHSVF